VPNLAEDPVVGFIVPFVVHSAASPTMLRDENHPLAHFPRGR
jgi:hypothetical protein